MFNMETPNLRVAIIGEPTVNPLGLGSAKTLTLYGSGAAVRDKHLVTRTVMDWLSAQGMVRWSIGSLRNARALSERELEEVTKAGDNQTTHRIDVEVSNPGF